MINVLNRSRAESTNEAVREMDAEYKTAKTFATTRAILTAVLTGRSEDDLLSCRSEERYLTVESNLGYPVPLLLPLLPRQ